MNKVIGIIVIILVIAAGFVGMAYWSGQQAERWYQEALVEASKYPDFKISSVRYERGIFSSQAATRYQLALPQEGAAELENIAFVTREDIYHGPLPLAGWGVAGVPMGLGGAVVRQTLDPESNAWIRQLFQLYGGQEPLVIMTRVGFGGGSDTQLTVPPLTAQNLGDLQELKFSGVQGHFQSTPRLTHLQGDLKVSSLEMLAKPEAASEEQPASMGGRVNLRDLALTLDQRKGPFELMLGSSHFKIGEVQIHGPEVGVPILLNDLLIEGTAALHPQNPQQINADVSFKAGKVTVEPWSGTGSIHWGFHNLDGAAFQQFQQWQQKMASRADEAQLMEELLKLFKVLLRGKPEFVLDSQAKLAQGDWQGKLTLNFQELDETGSLENIATLLKIVEKGSGELTVSKSLVDAMLSDSTKAQLPVLVSEGFIRLEGDHYKTVAHFADGKLTVNGRDIPLGLPASADQGNLQDGEELPLEEDGGVIPDDGAEEVEPNDGAEPEGTLAPQT